MTTQPGPADDTLLPYAAGPSAAGVRVDRHGDLLRIVIGVTRGRVLRIAAMIGLLALAAGGFARIWTAAADASLEPTRVGLGCFGVIACVGGVIALGKRLRLLLRPVTIEVDAGRVSVSRRVGVQIGRSQWDRVSVAGVRMMPAGWDESLRREWRLELWFSNGQGQGLCTGPRAQLRPVWETLSDALGYATTAAWGAAPERPSRRLTMTRYPGAVEFRLGGRWMTWGAAALFVPAIGSALALEHFVLGGAINPRGLFAVDDSWWPVMRVAVTTPMAWVAGVALKRRLTRHKSVIVAGGQLIAMESSAFSPYREQWPVESVAGFEVAPTTAGGRANLVVRLRDGRRADLVTGERVEDVRWIEAKLAEMFPAGRAVHGASA